VRVESRVTETPVEQDVQLKEERVTVERRPVDRPVSNTDKAFKEGSIEVTERAEEAVVAKEARVVEEVVINKEVGERTETVRDSVRRTDVDVTEVDTNKTRGAKGSR
jgi:stress response protein YsnF